MPQEEPDQPVSKEQSAMAPDNVRMFRPRQVTPSGKARLFSVIFPLAVSLLLFNTPLDSQGLTFFMVLGLIYWVFIRRHAIETSFFTRSHYLHTTMGLMLVYILAFLVLMVLGFLSAAAGLAGATSLVPTLSSGMALVALAYRWGVLGYGVLQALAGASGRTPTFPMVTPSVDAWA